MGELALGDSTHRLHSSFMPYLVFAHSSEFTEPRVQGNSLRGSLLHRDLFLREWNAVLAPSLPLLFRLRPWE